MGGDAAHDQQWRRRGVCACACVFADPCHFRRHSDGDALSRHGSTLGEVDQPVGVRIDQEDQRRTNCLAGGTLGALLVAAAGAGGADDNHATALAAVLVGGHGGVVVEGG